MLNIKKAYSWNETKKNSAYNQKWNLHNQNMNTKIFIVLFVKTDDIILSSSMALITLRVWWLDMIMQFSTIYHEIHHLSNFRLVLTKSFYLHRISTNYIMIFHSKIWTYNTLVQWLRVFQFFSQVLFIIGLCIASSL